MSLRETGAMGLSTSLYQRIEYVINVTRRPGRAGVSEGTAPSESYDTEAQCRQYQRP